MNTTQIKDFAQFARDYNWEDTQADCDELRCTAAVAT